MRRVARLHDVDLVLERRRLQRPRRVPLPRLRAGQPAKGICDGDQAASKVLQCQPALRTLSRPLHAYVQDQPLSANYKERGLWLFSSFHMGSMRTNASHEEEEQPRLLIVMGIHQNPCRAPLGDSPTTNPALTSFSAALRRVANSLAGVTRSIPPPGDFQEAIAIMNKFDYVHLHGYELLNVEEALDPRLAVRDLPSRKRPGLGPWCLNEDTWAALMGCRHCCYAGLLQQTSDPVARVQ